MVETCIRTSLSRFPTLEGVKECDFRNDVDMLGNYKVIILCGNTRFKVAFVEERYDEKG